MSPLYLIETDHGHLGTQITGYREDGKNDILRGLLSGEYGTVLKILELVEDEDSCRDVTEDFARDIADSLYASRDPVSYDMATWLQQQLGVTATHSLNMAA